MKLEFYLKKVSKIEQEIIATIIGDQLLKLKMPPKLIEALLNYVFIKYNGRWRYYHHSGHIFGLFQIISSSKTRIKNFEILQLAALFHDVIYNPIKKNNELKSAKFAKRHLKDFLPATDLELLYQIILSTAKHQPLMDNLDCKLFLDFDLAILASDWETYQKYAQAIRKEYFMYPNFMYKKGRKKVLEHFLDRERIFFTDLFFENFEEQAHENISKEIEEL